MIDSEKRWDVLKERLELRVQYLGSNRYGWAGRQGAYEDVLLLMHDLEEEGE